MPGNSSTETSEHFGDSGTCSTELVRDFNLYQFPGSDAGIHDAWKRIKTNGRSVLYGRLRGYWVLTRAGSARSRLGLTQPYVLAESVGNLPAEGGASSDPDRF